MMQLHSSSSSTLHVVSVLIKLGITTVVAVWMGNPLSLMLCPFSVFRSKRSMTVTEEKPHDGLCKSLPRCSKCDLPQSLSRSVYIWSRALSIKMSLSVSALCLIPLPSTHNPTYTRAHKRTHTHTHTHTPSQSTWSDSRGLWLSKQREGGLTKLTISYFPPIQVVATPEN